MQEITHSGGFYCCGRFLMKVVTVVMWLMLSYKLKEKEDGLQVRREQERRDYIQIIIISRATEILNVIWFNPLSLQIKKGSKRRV